ncbi:MAG: AMP-binding protein [Pseudomonadota bacterium]
MRVSPQNSHGADFSSSLSELTLPQILAKQAERLGASRKAIRKKSLGIWEALTWKDYLDYTRRTAIGLLSLGLKRGERVGIISGNEPEWLFSELASQALGAVTVNLFTTSAPDEIAGTLQRIEASYVIAQDQEQVDKLLEYRGELPSVRKVIYMDPTGMRTYADHPWLIGFRELLETFRDPGAEGESGFEEELWKGHPDDVAIMTLTSGTTGVPKLAMLSHRNFTEMGRMWPKVAPISEGDNWISITPPAWIVDQFFGVGVTLCCGMTMNFAETEDTLADDFREIGPAILITASRFWEDLASKIRVKIADSGFIKRKLFQFSKHIGRSVVERKAGNRPIPLYLKVMDMFASVAVNRPLLDRVGCSRFKAALTGGHPISPDVIGFFRAKGLNLKQCYGLTESCGIFQVQPDEEVKLETVGKPLPGIRVKIAEDQEVLVWSPTAFMGYFDNPEATEAAFDEGWLRTGDAGYIDEDGHLIIIGRKQDIMRTRVGEAFSPDFIETRLKFSPYIKEVVIFGEGEPYITAMINIDMGNVGSWAEDLMIPYTTYTDLSQQSAVQNLIMREIREVNCQLPDPMKIRKMVLLYKLLDADDGELTRTGKVRRHFVFERYASLIRSMYTDQDQVKVKGEVRYRDGQIGTIETTVKVLIIEEVKSK